MENNITLTQLEVRKTVSTDRDRVFKALTQPELMNQWMYGMDEGRAEVENNLRPGGAYSLKMIRPDGEVAYAPHGEYLEIDPPNKISMTWISEGFVDYSILSFELKKVDSGTEIILRHELPEFTVADHRDGWITCLGHCEKFFS